MGFEENSAVVINNSKRKDLNGADRRGGVGKGSFPFGEFKPEVVDVLGARLNAPRSKGIGGQARFKPIGEGLRGGEGVEAMSVVGWSAEVGM